MQRPRRRPAQPVPVALGDLGLAKLGAARFDLRDPYHLAVSLSWPAFVTALVAAWLIINLLFASLYVLAPGDVANVTPGSFADVFFFSVETLATVGYGVMAPATTYGHVISAAEIVTGTAFTAIVTGLLFVRFSRPKAKIIYAEDAVVTTHNARRTLMVRFANARTTLMTSCNARLFALHGFDADLATMDIRLFLTVEARDPALAAVVHDMKHYGNAHIRVGMRYADSVLVDPDGRATADLSRISLIEPDVEFGSAAAMPDWARWAR